MVANVINNLCQSATSSLLAGSNVSYFQDKYLLSGLNLRQQRQMAALTEGVAADFCAARTGRVVLIRSQRGGSRGAVEDGSSGILPVGSNPTREKQYDEDDQDDADDADATVTEAVAVAAEAATEAAEQKDHQKDDENESNRHDLSPVSAQADL